MFVMPSMPVRNQCVSVAFHRQIFSTEECDRILSSVDPNKWVEATVGGHGRDGGFARVEAVRSNRQQHVPMDTTGFPLNRILAEVSTANSDGWKFELAGVVYDDFPWIMRYDEGGKGHYDWHVDIGQGANASRKLGFTLQLSDGDSYRGGDLEFHNMNLDAPVLRKRGTLIAFPAYWLHRVAPMTAGSRHALVGWVHGPSFH